MFFRMVYKSGQTLLPFCHNARACDGQTDRQTDGQNCMQRGKKDE